MRKAVFLDRDDTLIRCNSLPAPPPPAAPGDVVDPEMVGLLPGARSACSRMKQAGYVLVVVSNQGVVARGGTTLEGMDRVNARVRRLLTVDGQELLDAVYCCPYHPRGTVPEWTREHPWRKPAPGMILAAAADLSLDLGRSWLVGDAARDVEAGVAAGIAPERCLRVGPGQQFGNLVAAAKVIVGAG